MSDIIKMHSQIHSQMTSSSNVNNDDENNFNDHNNNDNNNSLQPNLTCIELSPTSQSTIPTKNTDSTIISPISPSKLRQIAPALSKKSDYDIYHIPRGYEVLLVPKEDTVANPDIADVGSPISSTKPIIIPLPKSAQSQNNSSWRKRKSNDHIPRPKNCFMAYREHIQHEILQDNPGMNNKLVSVIAAQKWNEESEEVKETWREKAKQLKAEHQLKYPNYKFSPKKKPGKTVTGGRIQKSSKTRASANSKVVGLRKSNLTTESTMHDESAVVIGSPNLFHGNVDNSFWGHYRTPSGESSEWTTTSETSSNNSPSFEASSPGSFSPPTFQVPEFTRSTSPLRFERPPQYQSDTSTSPTINHFNLLETFDPYPVIPHNEQEYYPHNNTFQEQPILPSQFEIDLSHHHHHHHHPHRNVLLH